MRSSARSVLTFAGVLMALTVAYFALVYGTSRPQLSDVAPPDTIVATFAAAALPLDPSAPEWEAVPATRVRLLPQSARPPFGTQEREVILRAALADGALVFRLDFDDTTEDRAGETAADGCAVMLTAQDAPATIQMMGHGGAADIWHWTAGAEGEADAVRLLRASGPGTQAEAEAGGLEGRAHYTGDGWRVVLRRPLETILDGSTGAAHEAPLSIALAVWDGAASERLSSKSISVLSPLHIEGR